MRYFVLGLLILAGGGCGGAPLGCTLAECSDGFSITLRAPLEPGGEPNPALPLGGYELQVYLDGTPVACRGSLPNDSPFTCDSGLIGVSVVEPRLSGGVISGLQLTGELAPRVVDLSVRHQGELVAEQGVQLPYEDFTPNGRECGPICKRAHSELPLSFSAPAL